MEKPLHIKETDLELFVYSPERFSEEKSEKILTHLDNCSLCKDIYDCYHNIYSDISLRLNTTPDENDKELAARIANQFENSKNTKLLQKENSSVQIYKGKLEIVTKPKFVSLQNLYYLIKNYPVPSFGAVLVTALAIAFVVGQVRKTVKDDNPVYAEVKNGVLNIYNSSGDVLWKKTAYGIRDALLNGWFPLNRNVNIVDIDSDGKNEVLLSGELPQSGLFRSDSLYCFENNGTKRWVTGPENIHSGSVPNWKRTEWLIQDYFTISTLTNKRLFLVADDWTYAMSIVSEIDPMNGKVLSSIYHSGWFFSDLLLDLDNDGNDEVILDGTSNDYYRPVVMVLRAGGFKGEIDKNELLNPNDNHKGNALYYLLLPVTNYHQKYASTNVVELAQIGKTDKGFIVTTKEVQPKNENGTFGLVYSFDKNMQIRNIIPTNGFQKKYEALFKEGIFKEPLDSTYFNNLKNSILYWDGDKFVNYPTKNKYWNKK